MPRMAPAGTGVPVVSRSGFTLPEFLIVVTLLSLMASSVGVFGQWLDKSRVETTILNLRAALYSARAEAITRGGRVAICRRDGDLQDCAGISASGWPDWSQGWMMFWDVNRNRHYDADEGDLILRVYPPAHPSIKLHWNNGDYIAYRQSGTLDSRQGSFCIGLNGSESMKELVLARAGRMRVSNSQCSYSLTEL